MPLVAYQQIDRPVTAWPARKIRLYLVALVVPFVAALLALRHPRDPAARNLIWIFVVYYGAVFYIAPGSGADSVRYAEWLTGMHAIGFDFHALVNTFFQQGSRNQDIYQPLITWLISRFTDNHTVLFAAFGVLFGYVYSRNIWFLVDRLPPRTGPLLIFLLFAFAFLVDIGSGLNGVRMWTALHVFAFGILNYCATRKYRYLLVLALTPLIHFSFWLACIVAFAWLFARRLGLPIYVFFVVSYFGVVLDLGALKSVIGYLPLPIEERTASYVSSAELDPDAMMEQAQAAIWFLRLNVQLLSTFFLVSVSWMVWRGCLRHPGLVRNLLTFGMLMYAVMNLISYVPSLGRFYYLAELILLAALILFLAGRPPRARQDAQVIGVLAGLLALNLALGIRFTLEFASIWLLLGNFFLAPLVSPTESLYELLHFVLRGMR